MRYDDWKRLLVALLSSLSIACADDIEDDGVRHYSGILATGTLVRALV